MRLPRSIAFFLISSLASFSYFINCQNVDFIFRPDNNEKYEGSECHTSEGVKGVCRMIIDCPEGSSKWSKSDLCAFSKNQPVYCCATIDNLEDLPDELFAVYLKSLRPVDQICEHYYPSNKRDVSFFVGGVRSLAQQHPHMAAIGWKNFDDEVDWRCGGTVITLKFIITAAHCTSLNGAQPEVVRTGDLNLLVTENNTHPEDFKITNIYVHPQYKSTEAYHDIALLKISPDHSYSHGVKPACLWTSSEIPVQQLTGMGYGTTQFSGPQSNELFQGSLTILSHEDCSANIPNAPNIPSGIITGQFCAQDPQHIKDTCQGDSGGPLQFYNTSGFRTRPVIAGITSFGQYCAGRAPGVYTKVSAYIDWIEPILMSDFQIPAPLF